MKYYIKIVDGIIISFGRGKKVPKNNTEISEDEWNRLRNILDEIPDKDGYYKVVFLHVDGNYEVEYIEMSEDE